MTTPLEDVIAMTRELLVWEREIADVGVDPRRRAAAAVPAVEADPSVEPVAPAEPRPGMDPAEKRIVLATLQKEAATCTQCALHTGRTKSVFARGTPDAKIVFVGEGPGYHEDQKGEPFVGPAGQLLDKMIAAMGYGRDEVYVVNVVKCRPPENRTPLPPESAACSPFLVKQIETVGPSVIVALGRCAAEALGCVPETGPWRGVWRTWQQLPVMPTYHPAFLLRSPQFKRQVWDDLQKVMARFPR